MSGKKYTEQPELHTVAPHRAAQLIYPANFQAAMREALEDSSKTLFGIAHGIPSVFLTKLYASIKPDFIWIDVEHAMYDRLSLNDSIHAAQHHSEGKTMVFARVPRHDETVLVTALDAGAAAIIIPHCESASDITEMAKEIYYPPKGGRSFSPWVFTPGVTDASLYPNDPFNMRTSNDHIGIIAQIESVKGVENIDEIASQEFVSALMFGPGDFMADAGIPMKMGGEPHPVMADAMAKFIGAGKKYNKPLFGAAMAPEMVPTMIDQGFRAIIIFFDGWGITNVVNSSLQAGRKAALESASKAKNGTK